MKNKVECPYCDGIAHLKHNLKEITYKRERFAVEAHYYQCEKCSEEFTTTETDTLTMVQVYNMYREKHRLPFPEEIVAIRETYKLSAASMSEVLGLGINGYSNYERGEMPTSAIGNLILSAANPWVFKEMLLNVKDNLNNTAFRKALSRIEEEIEQKSLSRPFFNKIDVMTKPSSFTGYRRPNIEKVKALFTSFIMRCNVVLNDRLKLNKMMFYADFLHYKEIGYSISGLSYRAIPFGPVPSCYDNLFALLESEGIIFSDWQQVNDPIAREIFFVSQPADQAVLDLTESNVVDKLCNTLADTPSWDLVVMSHREDAWKALHEKKEIISYQEYAFGLKGV